MFPTITAAAAAAAAAAAIITTDSNINNEMAIQIRVSELILIVSEAVLILIFLSEAVLILFSC